MSNIKYALFKVYDYKGGELRSYVNLTKEQLISSLSEYFEDCEELHTDEWELLDKEVISKVIKKKVSDEYEFFSLYAGGDGFTGELYKIENNEMTIVKFEYFIEDIIEYINKNWRND